VGRRIVLFGCLCACLIAAAALAAPDRHRHRHRATDARYPLSVSCHRPKIPRGLIRPTAGVKRMAGSVVLGLSANLRSNRGGGRCALAALARALGVRSVREDLSWASVEPRPGEFVWGRFDAVLRAAAQHGLTVLPLLDETPRWATSGGDSSLPPDPAAFADFAARAAVRYGPGGQFWQAHPAIAGFAPAVMEVYNEPYWRGVDPAAYAALVRRTADAVRAANARVQLLAEVTPGAWLDSLYAADPAIFSTAATAGAAVHPYGADTAARVAGVHAQMTAHGDGAIGVWITEVGWPTCPSDPADCVSEPAQAKDLATTLALARTAWQPWLRALFVYDLRDYGSPGRDKEQYFGLLRPDGSAKPALGVLAAAGR
jgi:hypothetical protein